MEVENEIVEWARGYSCRDLEFILSKMETMGGFRARARFIF